jgi:Family of unknown function (DUF6516)
MRRRRRETLTEYVAARCDDIHGLGGTVAALATTDVGGEVIIQAIVTFEREGRLTVFEAVHEDEGGTITRRKYSYQAMWRSDTLFRYDRDPVAHPEMPEHKHVAGRRERWDAVTLRDVVDELWDLLGQHEAEDG